MPEKSHIRLQKFLADRGAGSRRFIESLISKGDILVDGKPAHIGQKVNGEEVIFIQGRPFKKDLPQEIWIAFYKPRGVECTMKKQKNVKTLADYDWGGERVYPVGRLDKNSRGLVLLTNAGEKAFEMTHPKFQHEKEYQVRVDKPLTQNLQKKLSEGHLVIEGKKVAPCTVEIVSPYTFKILLHEGRNRQIRKMCGQCGLTVRDLCRVRMGKVLLEDLLPGEKKIVPTP